MNGWRKEVRVLAYDDNHISLGAKTSRYEVRMVTMERSVSNVWPERRVEATLSRVQCTTHCWKDMRETS